MPHIHFKKGRPPIEVKNGSNLMESLLAHGIPVASSCQGDGICAKCRLVVEGPHKNLSPIGEQESFLREKFGLASNERISCQAQVLGDVEVDASYW